MPNLIAIDDFPFYGDRGDGLPTHWSGADSWPWGDSGCEIDWQFLQLYADRGFSPEEAYEDLIREAKGQNGSKDGILRAQLGACHALVALNFLSYLSN